MNDLLDAVEQNDIPRAETLLKNGADPNDFNPNVWDVGPSTFLLLAIRQYSVGMVELLLRYGADPNATRGIGMTPLAQAAAFGTMTGMTDILNLLLIHGADVNLPSIDARTPLYHAVFRMNVEQIELLLAHGADVNIPQFQGKTPFWTIMACDKPSWVFRSMKRLLLTYYAKIDASNNRTKDTLSLFHVHCVHKNQPIPTDFTSYLEETFTIDREIMEIINRYRLFLEQDREHTRWLQSWMKQRLIYYYLLFVTKRITKEKILAELKSVHFYTEAGAKAAWVYITGKYPPMSLTMITHLQRLPDDLLHTLSTFMTKDIEYSFDDFTGMHPCCATIRERFDKFTPV